MNELKYTIAEFDESNRIIEVVFDDGNRARILLTLPFPNTLEELEAIIRDYAPSVEDIQAATTPSNFSYIHEAVGQEKTTIRKERRIVAAPEIPPVEIPVSPDIIVTTIIL